MLSCAETAQNTGLLPSQRGFLPSFHPALLWAIVSCGARWSLSYPRPQPGSGSLQGCPPASTSSQVPTELAEPRQPLPGLVRGMDPDLLSVESTQMSQKNPGPNLSEWMTQKMLSNLQRGGKGFSWLFLSLPWISPAGLRMLCVYLYAHLCTCVHVGANFLCDLWAYF